MLYKYFAVYIPIQGIYKVPVLCQRNGRPLRSSIDEARNYFRSIYPDDPPPCGKVLERLFTHILISRKFYERLSTRFQGLMRSLGSSVSGDEKLFHFTGNSCHIMLVPSKVFGCMK